MNLSAKLFALSCSVMSFFGRFRIVNSCHFSMTILRFFYSSLCVALTGRRESVGEIEDVFIPGPGGEIKLRIYSCLTFENCPAFIFLHGGSFCVGDLDSHDVAMRALANASGSTIIAVDFRRAPENPFPAAIEDAYATLCWVAANATTLRINREEIAVGGDSSGGALAAVLSRWSRDRSGPGIALQVLIYPLTDSSMQSASWKRFSSGPAIDRPMVESAWARYAPKGEDRCSPDVAPLAARDLHDLPPAVVITAEHDPLHDEGEAYAQALKEHGVRVQFTCYPGTVHGFFQFPGTAVGRKAINEIAAALRERHLQPEITHSGGYVKKNPCSYRSPFQKS